MKIDFNGAVRNALKEQEAIRELLERIEAGDFGEEIKFYEEMIDAWNGESAFLLGELSEKINIVAEELRKGNSEIIKEFFDFLCIDISKKESRRNEQQRDDCFNNGNPSYLSCSEDLYLGSCENKRIGGEGGSPRRDDTNYKSGGRKRIFGEI